MAAGMSDVLFFLAAFLAEVVGTLAGFGPSTIFLPLALFFVDFPTAPILVAFFHIFGSLGKITFFRHGLDKRLLLTFGLPSVLLTVAGAFLVPHVAQDLLKLILGAFLIIFSITSLLKPHLAFPATNESAMVGGGVSGFLAGLIGTGGALRGGLPHGLQTAECRLHCHRRQHRPGRGLNPDPDLHLQRLPEPRLLPPHARPFPRGH
jgi:hypothetical protein